MNTKNIKNAPTGMANATGTSTGGKTNDTDTRAGHSESTGSATPTYNEAAVSAKLAGIGVGGNIALSAFKLFAGIFGGSAAMISDAVHSLSDVFATAIAYIGVRLSKRAADDSHPYGHERFESIASMLLGIILAATGLSIGMASVRSIATGTYLTAAAPGMIALVAAVVSIAVKEGMFWYTRHWARILDSSAFMADAWHHRSDALSSIGALAGIAGAMMGYAICDPIASIVICVIILKVAVDIIRNGVDSVTDTPCTPEFENSVRACIDAVPGVDGIDSLRTRRFGNKVYVDAEIAVDGTLMLADAHNIAEAAHDTVEREFPTVKHIMIHENPSL